MNGVVDHELILNDKLIIKIDAIQHAVAVQIESKYLKPIKKLCQLSFIIH